MRASNPILPGTYPDPSICRVGEWFYLVSSTFEHLPGLPVHRSRDLLAWEPIGHVVDRPGMLDYAGIPSSGGLYAPTIRHRDGVFWVVCTLVTRGAPGRGGTFVVTATDPAGPWSEPSWLDVDGIDPSILVASDGRLWAHGTRLAPDPAWEEQTEVWLRELDPEARRLVGPESVIWTGALLGAVWAEGPHLYEIDGTFLLLAAEGGTDLHHAVCVARADDVRGPYVGHRANPVLTHRHLGRGAAVVGVGHADLVQAVDGSWWAVLLAMRPYGGYHYPLGRETFLVPVAWEDGWPLFAPGTGRVPDVVDVPFATGAAPGVTQGFARGPVPPGDPRWNGVRALPTEVGRVVGASWVLPVRPATLADVAVPSFLGVRQQHRDLDLILRLRADLAAGEEVGLAVRQSENDHAVLAVGRGAVSGPWVARVVHRRSGVEHATASVVLEGGGDDVVLRLRARGLDLAFTAAVGDRSAVEIGTVDVRTLDSVSAGGFLGLWLGALATSHGRDSSSVVRVDSLEYVPVVGPSAAAG
ncbi:glycoside hydrolase family 43 protein [Serinibacter arcticus]|uniref:Beta-xylosidase n=1 Tax=Serinibacter arcticus TaxID=1655435 RepID=A0A4Z1E731_9MICO|nr:glycoside hydrolase family 43 protein [Serinibacter arcticus]TGO05391.1 Beta-xylosidase [Serinibacter arcticus]